MRTWMLGLAAGVVAIAASAWAGPLNPGWVSPEATWVVHVDIEAAVGSTLGRSLLQGDGKVNIEGLDELEQELGMNPLTDLKGITAFGTSDEEKKALVLVTATAAVDRVLAELPGKVQNYRKIEEGSRTIHAWSQDGDDWFVYVRPGQDASERVVVAAGDIERLRACIISLEQNAAGARHVAAPVAKSLPRPGSMLFVSASEIPPIDEGFQGSAMMKYAKSLVLDLGEGAGQLYAEAALEADTPENAATTTQLVQGLMALGRMAAAGDPEAAGLARMIDGVKVSTAGAVMTLKCAFDSSAIAEMIRQIDHDERGDADGKPAQRGAEPDSDHGHKKSLKARKAEKTPK